MAPTSAAADFTDMFALLPGVTEGKCPNRARRPYQWLAARGRVALRVTQVTGERAGVTTGRFGRNLRGRARPADGRAPGPIVTTGAAPHGQPGQHARHAPVIRVKPGTPARYADVKRGRRGWRAKPRGRH